ncbi:MAG: DUF4124 domain-containing protein [Guyparkeria sp.]|uniref:DUF4124 domain-containing protein n=1 Tax=Guyparkeria sp. TaxID=2035736 RepID=UPI00397A6F5D
MHMRHRQALAGVIAIILPLLATQAANAATYRWVDADGQLQFSDTLPSAAAANGYKVIDSGTGQVIREVAPRKTDEEKAREEAQRQAEEDARLAEDAERKHNQVLMALYSSVEDIEQARDSRLARLDARIRQLESSTARMEEKARNSPNDGSYARDLKNLKASLEDARSERNEVEQRFEQDIQRFRDLKANG